jgi:hypothetical protein
LEDLKVKIDKAKLISAIANTNPAIGYLNRVTGQIQFLAEGAEPAEDLVRIQKRPVNDQSADAFIERFLTNVGIDPAVCV